MTWALLSSHPKEPSQLKTCNKCGLSQPLDQFSWKNKAEGKRNAQCKSCHREYSRQHYSDNWDRYSEKVKAYKRARKEANNARLARYLVDHPCVDCGESDIDILQFDHIELVGGDGDRVTNLLHGPWDRIQEEIDKCQVRCVSCHYRRTRTQLGRKSRYSYL